MTPQPRWELPEIERRVCDVASRKLGIERSRISASDRIIEDLHCDSLDLADLFMEIEREFDVTLTDDSPNPIYKAVFTRQPFRLSDFAELVYLQRGTGTPDRGWWGRPKGTTLAPPTYPFTQLGGCWQGGQPFEPLEKTGSGSWFRRRSDGMRCVLLPAASVEIGSDDDTFADERPRHVVHLDAFLIDAEPVSTTAYCRFLNSIAGAREEDHRRWFELDPEDDRNEHVQVEHDGTSWRPRQGTERHPMILVSWHGANAYSLWANGIDWRRDQPANGAISESFLPTEAQWEYAARGATHRPYPWGDEPPTPDRMRYGCHRRGETYRVDALPMADVNAELGMSPFGLHHMAGNAWQWCRDWYDPAFYAKPEASTPNPVNRTPGKVRSERGGSWVGPASLCRSSFRRGRPPLARGRCLGFRCISQNPLNLIP